MRYMVPVSPLQLWAFWAFALIFFAVLFRVFFRRREGGGAKRDGRSRFGIGLQALGIGVAGAGPVNLTLAPFALLSLVSTACVILLLVAATWIFGASSAALGRNWSIVARTRDDHQLIRTGPYARVRHPIYLGLLFFLFAMAIAFGHWLQLIAAVPLYLAGTRIRASIEDCLLEQAFGDAFREYRNSTPALLPRL